MFGSGQGLQGRIVPFLMIFFKSVLQMFLEVVVHENVTTFPVDILIKVLGSPLPLNVDECLFAFRLL